MNPEHSHFAEWDAAYLLGALSVADRRVFEEHLQECDECRRAVADLAPTIGLLSRVSAQRAGKIGAAENDGILPEPDLSVRAGLLSLDHHRTLRRRRVWWISATAAAVVLIVAAIAVPLALTNTGRPAQFAMAAVDDAPLEATVSFRPASWGTSIDIECEYTSTAATTKAEQHPYVLTVIGTDGTSWDISSWRGQPGDPAQLSAATAYDLKQIRTVEIRSVSSGRVLMQYDVG